MSGCTTLVQCVKDDCHDTMPLDRNKNLPGAHYCQRGCERWHHKLAPVGWDITKYVKPVISKLYKSGRYTSKPCGNFISPDITRFCSQMRKETLPMFYGNQHWYYEAFHAYMDSAIWSSNAWWWYRFRGGHKRMINIHKDLLKWIDAIGPEATGMIRNLTVLYNRGMKRAHDIEFTLLPALKKRGLKEGVLDWREIPCIYFPYGGHLEALLRPKPPMTEQELIWRINRERRKLGCRRPYKGETLELPKLRDLLANKDDDGLRSVLLEQERDAERKLRASIAQGRSSMISHVSYYSKHFQEDYLREQSRRCSKQKGGSQCKVIPDLIPSSCAYRKGRKICVG